MTITEIINKNVNAWAVLGYMLESTSNGKDFFDRSLKLISDVTSIPMQQVRTALKDLADFGLVTKDVTKGLTKSNAYLINCKLKGCTLEKSQPNKVSNKDANKAEEHKGWQKIENPTTQMHERFNNFIDKVVSAAPTISPHQYLTFEQFEKLMNKMGARSLMEKYYAFVGYGIAYKDRNLYSSLTAWHFREQNR